MGARFAIALLSIAAVLALSAGSAWAAAPTHPALPALSHEGNLGYTCGAAVDSSGYLYTVEYSNSRVKIFDPSGAFVTQFDAFNAGGPCGIAVDSAGNVYVAGWQSNVIKFSPGGAGYPPTPATTYSSSGTLVANGAMGVAVDPQNDDVYVALNDHIASYEPDGTPISTTIAQGLIPGAEFRDVDVYGPNGDLYVTDVAHNKAYVLNPQGTAVLVEIDGSDSTKGAFTGMTYPNLAVDQSNGHVYVSDVPGHHVVDEFDAAGHFVAEIAHTPQLTDGFPTGIAVDNSGGPNEGVVYVTSGEEFPPVGSVYAFGPLVYGHELKVTKSGSGGGTVAGGSAAKPNGIDCGLTCATTFEDGAEIVLTATPDAHSTFAGWTGCETEPSPSECKVTVSSDKSVTANFIARKLKVKKEGPGTATITSSPAGIACGSTCSGTFPDGAVVTLTAAPNPGSRVNRWSGCAEVLGPNGQECKLTMSADAEVTVRLTAKPTVGSLSVTHLSDSSARLNAAVNPQGEETSYHFEYTDEADFLLNGFANATAVPVPDEDVGSGTVSVSVFQDIAGLLPHTGYRFRLVGENVVGTIESDALSFTTFIVPESFDSCSNDAFRGASPSGPLPDCRAYEQASPVDKNGNDLVGDAARMRASVNGDRIAFQASAPIPGGEAARTPLPYYLASRNASGWSTRGLETPQKDGDNGEVFSWTPDFSHSYSWTVRFTTPPSYGLFDRSNIDGTTQTIFPQTPFAKEPGLAVPGSSDDGSVVFFERVGLPLVSGANQKRTLYAWDRETGHYYLAGVFNNETTPTGGAFAGPYSWMGKNPALGGAEEYYFTHDQHAVSTDGSSVYFTAAGSGQLYLRRNVTKPQSDVVINGNGEEECTQPELACTIHVSASHKENGTGVNGADPAGARPAAFMGATPDGLVAYFTSSEKLTDDANTGPEQQPARIGRAKLGETEAEEPKQSLLPKHANGLAVSPDGEYLYWADPSKGTIGRARLTEPPSEINDEFIVPGETKAELMSERGEPGVFTSAPSTPRYVAVDDEYVYWTNTGPRADYGIGDEPVDGAGTIGRAKLNGIQPPSEDEIEPEFLTGASNPQGIAVNSEHIYWANGYAGGFSFVPAGPKNWISRAAIDGHTVQLKFHGFESSTRTNTALALSSTDVYVAHGLGSGELARFPLGNGEEEGTGVGFGTVNGIALAGPYIYWTSEEGGGIGRIPVNDLVARGCFEHPGECKKNFLPVDGSLGGLATHDNYIYWGVNGETPANPGNDLYRYDVEAGLTDITPDSNPADVDGAEVRGLLGSSNDGSYVYFAANGQLAPGASPGDCTNGQSPIGSCNLYVEQDDGQIEFISRLDASGGDGGNWRGADDTNGETGKLSRVSADGRTLLFMSSEKLTPYDNEGVPELYRYHVGDAKPIVCVSCNLTGLAPSTPPRLEAGRGTGGLGVRNPMFVLSRNLSEDGNRVFFDSDEALVVGDTNGFDGCGQNHQCQDVYEWEAHGTGSCHSEAQNGGCLYLISSGKGTTGAYFADASANGDDVFFFTRDRLVNSDQDSFYDMYDARVGGGLASQNGAGASSPPCEGEACKSGTSTPPATASPTTSLFSGPGNPKPHHKKAKAHRKKRRHKHHRHAKSKGRTQ
jgi:sugar lactone lactonase YvrE